MRIYLKIVSKKYIHIWQTNPGYYVGYCKFYRYANEFTLMLRRLMLYYSHGFGKIISS